MKQLLFLLLFPCLALAQYQGNAGQKITLGEQTTADGLVYRGVLNDTALITPFSDTSAYIILDTVNNRFYNYNRATNVWSVAGGGVSVTSFSAGTTGLTPSTATTGAVTLGGTLAVANGGTNTSTAFTQGSVVFAGTSGTYTQDNTNLFWDNTNKRLGIGTSSPGQNLDVRGNSQVTGFGSYGRTVDGTYKLIVLGQGSTSSTFAFGVQDINGINLLLVRDDGNVGIRVASPTERLHVVGNARITGNIAAGVTSATARLHLAAGTSTASTAPLKFTTQGASLLNPVEAGAVEFNGTNLLFTPSTTRHTVNHGLTGSATLDFPSTTTLLSADLTITVTGAADGDVVSLGVPNAAVNANTSYSAWVSAANTVTVRFNNYSSGTVNPASGTFKVFVTK